MVLMLTSKEDFAKYPFTKEANDFVTNLDLKLSDLANRNYVEIVNRAEQRVEETIIENIVKWHDPVLYDIEILSFPVAVAFVTTINDDFLKKRYALAESKKTEILLRKEKDEKILDISNSLNWKIKKANHDCSFDYFLIFTDYLKNAPSSYDRWKLVNRTIIEGNVCLKKNELARLLSEEIRKYVERIIENSPKVQLPPLLHGKIERINQILNQRRESIGFQEYPKVTSTAAFPPCVKRLYDSLLIGRHISHIGRFTLTSFFLNLGMSIEELLKLYNSASDFDEKLTRYQIEHIAGKKGSGTKYVPPKCDTLKTHGVCIGPDDLCKTINHPLSYYRRKIKLIKDLESANND